MSAPEAKPATVAGPAPHAGRERLIEAVLLGCALVTVLITGALLWALLGQTLAFFSQVSLSEFFSDRQFAIGPLLLATLSTTAIAVCTGFPLGLLAAIHLAEYASPRQRRVLLPMLEIIAGLPTIVFAYFALLWVTPALQRAIPGLADFNGLSAGLVIGLLLMPMIAVLAEAAIRSVPRSLREAAWALGVDELRTIVRVVLPAAAAGIGATLLLALSRAIGETMIVTIAAGARPLLTLDPRVPVETMSAHVVGVALSETPMDTALGRSMFVIGAGLFVMTVAINVGAQGLLRRARGGRP